MTVEELEVMVDRAFDVSIETMNFYHRIRLENFELKKRVEELEAELRNRDRTEN